MTEQALFITASGGFLVLALFGWMWWRMSQRTRRLRHTELGKSTIQEFQTHKRNANQSPSKP